MKKKMCFTIFLFGEKYQGFIPLYLYSIFSSYPKEEYEVYFFLEGKLNENVKKNCESIKDMASYKVFENYLDIFNGKKVSSQVKKSLRWLIYEEEFEEFNSVYMGDIDIFICEESPGIYEQHLQHCQEMQLPYSNVIRVSKRENNKSVSSLLLTYMNNGIKGLFKKNESITKRLSGLHFMLQPNYFEEVAPLQKKYLSYIQDKRQRYQNFNHHPNGFHNESLLYDLMDDAKFKLPEIPDKGLLLHPKESKEIGFRPHHGIHLGIFRDQSLINNENDVLSSDIYIKYYNEFCYKRSNDKALKQILDNSSDFIKELINNMDSYYQGIKEK